MATPPPPFYVVEAFGPGHIGLWTLCPACLQAWEVGGRRLRVAAELPADGAEPRSCSDCERPQVGYCSALERLSAVVLGAVGDAVSPTSWEAGVRQAPAEDPPF